MKNFEDRLARLEEISRNINDECPLEEAVKLFEEGIKLSNGLEKELSKIERKVEILVNNPNTGESGSSGNPEALEKPETGSQPVMDLFPDLEE